MQVSKQGLHVGFKLFSMLNNSVYSVTLAPMILGVTTLFDYPRRSLEEGDEGLYLLKW